jgi:hypothetical protein
MVVICFHPKVGDNNTYQNKPHHFCLSCELMQENRLEKFTVTTVLQRFQYCHSPIPARQHFTFFARLPNFIVILYFLKLYFIFGGLYVTDCLRVVMPVGVLGEKGWDSRIVFLFAVFGVSSWISINGIFLQFPQLIGTVVNCVFCILNMVLVAARVGGGLWVGLSAI